MANLFPSTWKELEPIVFDTCEDFIVAARRIATSHSISLTISHKSRNTPGKEAVQHRGCLVLNCLRFDDRTNPCKLSIKAYGPIDGGWKMRPVLDGTPKTIVASVIQCNHPPDPLRIIPVSVISNWNDMLEKSFDMTDDFIDSAILLANSTGLELHLLTLMISDGLPKNNGRNSTYTPRGFLTLECSEALNGCPVAIKAREETDGWYMRPWRERGKGDLKGAVSYTTCKHGPEIKAAFLAKQLEKASKPKTVRKPAATKIPKILNDPLTKEASKKVTEATLSIASVDGTILDEPLSLPIIVNESHLNVDSTLANPLLPLLPPSHDSDTNISSAVSNHLTTCSSVDDRSNLYRMDLSAADFTDPFSNFSNIVHHSPIASTSSHIFSNSPQSLHHVNHNFPPYQTPKLSSDNNPNPTIVLVKHSPLHHLNNNHHNHLSQQHHNQLIDVSLTLPPLPPFPQLSITTSPIQDRQAQQQRSQQIPLELLPLLPDSPSRSPLFNLSPPVNTTSSTSNPIPIPAPSTLKRTGEPTTLETRAAKRIRNRSTITRGVTGGLKTTWKRFLVALDPLGRLSSLTNNLSSQGGIDPGAVVNWEGEDVKDFLERVASDVPSGVLIHFRVLLAADGKKIWSEMGGKG